MLTPEWGRIPEWVRAGFRGGRRRFARRECPRECGHRRLERLRTNRPCTPGLRNPSTLNAAASSDGKERAFFVGWSVMNGPTQGVLYTGTQGLDQRLQGRLSVLMTLGRWPVSEWR